MAVLGVDFGQRRIGLALSEGFLARPYDVLQNDQNFFSRLKAICVREAIEKIVLGLPEGENQAKVKKFAKEVKNKVDLPIFFVSEVMSSKEAQKRLIQSGRSRKYRRSVIDAASAAVILESYLNQNQPAKNEI